MLGGVYRFCLPWRDGGLMMDRKWTIENIQNLIKASPDLYDALQAMVDYCNAECGSKIYPGHQANQALAKARGETK